jgi:hypothetical protein
MKGKTMTSKKVTLEQGYASECCPWAEEKFEQIPFHITPQLRQQIRLARQVLKANQFRAISLDIPEGCWDRTTHDQLQEAMTFDIARITVYLTCGVYLELQSKWDPSCECEYGFNL